MAKVVTVIIALFQKDHILILQRGSTAPWEPNKWSLVGGIVDPNEDELTAIKREVKEETQLVPFDIKRLGQKEEEWGTLVFYVGSCKGKPVLDYENQDYAWVTKDTYTKYKYVPSVREFISKLFR